MAICPNCGQAISPEARFCGSCGTTVGSCFARAAGGSPRVERRWSALDSCAGALGCCSTSGSASGLERQSGRPRALRHESCFDYRMDAGSQRTPSSAADERNNWSRFDGSRSSLHPSKRSACHRLDTDKRHARLHRGECYQSPAGRRSMLLLWLHKPHPPQPVPD